jgi:hypothetical protein
VCIQSIAKSRKEEKEDTISSSSHIHISHIGIQDSKLKNIQWGKSQWSNKRKEDTLCTQYIVKSCKDQERRENLHFALKFHHKMLNPKVKSHKEQAREESLDALYTQSFVSKC